MLERWNQLSGQLAVVSSIALVTYVYLRILTRKFKDLAENVEWFKLHKIKLALIIGVPTAIIYGPAVEELFFRAPLIILFDQVSDLAWSGIIVSSAIFAAMHYFNSASSFLGNEILETAELSGKTFSEATKDVEEKEKSKLRIMKLWKVGFTFVMGLVLGYCSIKYQSLYLVAGLHALWNLVGSIVITLFVLLVCITVELIATAFRKRRWRKQFRKAMMPRWQR